MRGGETGWLPFVRSSHKEVPSRIKQAEVFATIFTGANPQLVRGDRRRSQPAKPESPMAMENTLAAEAKALSLLTKPGSAGTLM